MRTILALVVLLVIASACGNKGDLFIPEPESEPPVEAAEEDDVE